MIFGVHCPTYDHPIIEDFFRISKDLERLLRPGGHPPIDVFPLLKYVPERWAVWKTVCKQARSRQLEFYSKLVDRCLKRIANNERNGSHMEHLLDIEVESGSDREST